MSEKHDCVRRHSVYLKMLRLFDIPYLYHIVYPAVAIADISLVERVVSLLASLISAFIRRVEVSLTEFCYEIYYHFRRRIIPNFSVQ